MATLYIIAGPNGAGKSTTSAALLQPINIKAFDYDQELEQAWRRFDFDPAVEDGVRNSVSELFLEKKNLAIKDKTDFAFETNYHHESVPQSITHFKDAGHQTVMIFLALPSEESAIVRVKRRVLQGGHSVDEKTIRDRYKKGLQLLDSTFDIFDRLHLFLSQENKVKPILMLEPSQNIVNQESIDLMEHLPRLEAFIRPLLR